MSPFNEDSALLLQLIQAPLQRIFLNAEMVSQFLPGGRQKNIFRLLKADLLLEIKDQFFSYTHGEHTNFLGQLRNNIGKYLDIVHHQSRVIAENLFKIGRHQTKDGGINSSLDGDGELVI